MAIEFHCEHCNHLIKAPDDAGGRTGRCPHCHNAAYIPRRDDEGEIDLAPLDEDDEAKRRKAAMEAAAYQRSLLHERNVPGEKGGKPAAGGKPGAPGTFTSPTKHITTLIVAYVEAMSSGKLEKADSVFEELRPQKATVVSILDEMARDDLGMYGLPALPKPVLMGFLKQLRQKL